MEIRDDEHFEAYLKEFRPVAPKQGMPSQMESKHDGVTWLTPVAAVLLMAAFAIRLGQHEGTIRQPVIVTEARSLPAATPLTISRANLQLARSKSVKAALNEIAFRRPATAIPPGSQSALEVLAKEKTGL